MGETQRMGKSRGNSPPVGVVIVVFNRVITRKNKGKMPPVPMVIVVF